MMQATGSVATNFLKSNMVQYQPRVSGYWNTLKVYFTVSEGGGPQTELRVVSRVYFYSYNYVCKAGRNSWLASRT